MAKAKASLHLGLTQIYKFLNYHSILIHFMATLIILVQVFMRPSSLGGGPHIASHSVCPSVCLSVRPVIVTERHVAPPSELQ